MDDKKILIALNVEEEAAAFTSRLSRMEAGYSAVKDGVALIESAIRQTPSLIVTDLDLPVIDAQRVFGILRHNPHTSTIPFVFVSERASDIKDFMPGFDTFLIRPLNYEEVSGRIRQVLLREAGTDAGGKGLEGSLAQMPLTDLLQFLSLNRKEGLLKVTSGSLSGTVMMKDGHVYNAVLGSLEREKALFRLLKWSEGRFEFVHRPVTAQRKIRTTTSAVLMEGMRQIDEFKKKSGTFPDGKAVLMAKAGLPELPKGLHPIIHETLNLIKTYSVVEDVVEHSSYPDYDVYGCISALISKGILEAAGAPGFLPEGLLAPDQAVKLKERVASRFSDMNDAGYGKIYLLSASGQLASRFINQCRHIPGFSINSRQALALETPLGESASITMHGGMELVLFAIPSINNMGPLWKAFSTNLIGIIILLDGNKENDIGELAEAKQEILARRRAPVVHVLCECADDEERYKKAFNLKPDDPVFMMDFKDTSLIQEILYSIFSNLLKEDYIA